MSAAHPSAAVMVTFAVCGSPAGDALVAAPFAAPSAAAAGLDGDDEDPHPARTLTDSAAAAMPATVAGRTVVAREVLNTAPGDGGSGSFKLGKACLS